MIHIILFIGHPPPCEVHLFPWCIVDNMRVESIVTFRSVEILLKVEPIVEVRDCTGNHCREDGTFSEEGTVLMVHAFDYASTQHLLQLIINIAALNCYKLLIKKTRGFGVLG